MGEVTALVKGDETPGITRKTLQERVNKRLGQLEYALARDGLLEKKIAVASFKDVTIAEAVLIDKWLLLNDQPTQIVGYEERKKLDELLPALTAELMRRGFTAQMEARQASMTVTIPATVPELALVNPPK